MHTLHPIFHPESVAVIGASPREGKVGNSVIKNILSEGFAGKVYAVNPGEKEVLGQPSYASVLDIPDKVDMAVIVIPANLIPPVMEECGRKGVKGAVIISAGFSEGGGEGRAREAAVLEAARKYGIRVIGPNCLGVISLHESLNATFARTMPPKGPIAFISQSGAFCTAAIEFSLEEFIGFSYFVSTGNKADVDEADLVEYFAGDAKTKCIAIYMEAAKDGRRLFDAVREAVKRKPVVVLKSGRTEIGAKAASSHTGAIAGSDTAYSAAFRQAGAYRAQTMFDLFDSARALAYQPPFTVDAEGQGVAILTNAGGPGVIAADTAYDLGLPLARLSDATVAEISKYCPPTWSRGNPVDIIGDADTERYSRVLDVLLRSEEVKAVILIASRQAATNLFEIAKWVVFSAKNTKKPITASFTGIVHEEAENYMDSHGIPEMEVPERAVKAMNTLFLRGKILGRERRPLEHAAAGAGHTPEKEREIQEIITAVQRDGRCVLDLEESRAVLAAMGIPLDRARLAGSGEEAVAAARALGYPVAMKIVSPDIIHKTEAGGVRIGILDDAGMRNAYRAMMESVKRYKPDARVKGVLVEEMVKGTELIIGTTRDPQFGPLLMFGMGGVFVEVYKDVSFRLMPITPLDAAEMVEGIRGKAIYEGIRGFPVAPKKELCRLLLAVSHGMERHREIAEMDINPLMVTKDGLVAVDARVILQRREGGA